MPHFSLHRRPTSSHSTSPRSASARSNAVRSAAVGLALGAAVIAAPSAQAHDSLVGANPAADSVVQAAPAQLILSFRGSVLPEGSRVAVKNPAGGSTAATPKVSGALVTAPFRADGPGVYVVTWRVTSADGHPVSGSYRFTLAGATGTAAPTSASSLAPPAASLGVSSSQSTVKGPTTPTVNEPGDNHPVPIIVGSLAALAAIAGGYAIARRRMTNDRS